mmetsp:Transcript_29893/g.62487  ORF Transcript_29893/g.62487 Transcript_29893/m.62487 type:complete len:310 (-) Transcript_29893:52-981(-)
MTPSVSFFVPTSMGGAATNAGVEALSPSSSMASVSSAGASTMSISSTAASTGSDRIVSSNWASPGLTTPISGSAVFSIGFISVSTTGGDSTTTGTMGSASSVAPSTTISLETSFAASSLSLLIKISSVAKVATPRLSFSFSSASLDTLSGIAGGRYEARVLEFSPGMRGTLVSFSNWAKYSETLARLGLSIVDLSSSSGLRVEVLVLPTPAAYSNDESTSPKKKGASPSLGFNWDAGVSSSSSILFPKTISSSGAVSSKSFMASAKARSISASCWAKSVMNGSGDSLPSNKLSSILSSSSLSRLVSMVS